MTQSSIIQPQMNVAEYETPELAPLTQRQALIELWKGNGPDDQVQKVRDAFVILLPCVKPDVPDDLGKATHMLPHLLLHMRRILSSQGLAHVFYREGRYQE